jgi:hypothetical protein
MREPRRRALLIGIEHYLDERFSRLASTRADTARLREVLSDRTIGAFDEVIVESDVTADQLRQAIADFCSAPGTDELALLYISGHGLRSRDGEFHFVATDTDADDVPRTAVRAGFVNEHLEECYARQRIAMFDTCESGAFALGLRTVPTKGPVVPQPAPLAPRGVYVLGSSDATQASYSGGGTVSDPEPSVFTGAVVDVLRTGAAGSSTGGMVSVDDLFEAVADRLRACDPPQTPVKSATRVTGAFPIAARPLGAAVRHVGPIQSRAEQQRHPAPNAPPDWPRLLAYFADVVRAESVTSELLPARGGEHVVLQGRERLLLGDLDSHDSIAVPAEAADLVGDVVGDVGSTTLWAGWPAVVLYEKDGRRLPAPAFAPLLVRQVEVVEDSTGRRLRADGPILPNPQLAHQLLDPEDAVALALSYVPSWHRGESTAMARDARILIEETFGLPCIEELRPQHLSSRIDLGTSGAGARNVAVLFPVKNTATTTAQLVKDLERIRDRPVTISSTALAALFPGTPPGVSALEAPDPVLPRSANAAQLAVLRSAFTKQLTVATGPPGTGKSQLVVDVVTTAVAAGQRVVVATTNNQAVDEVHRRCEQVCPGLVLRTGNKQNRLLEAEGLDALLRHGMSARPSETAERAFRSAQRRNVEVEQIVRDVAERELELRQLGQTRTDARMKLRRTAQECDEQLGPAWGERASRLAGARVFGTWRRNRFLRPAGLDGGDTAGTCSALAELAAVEARWHSTYRLVREGPSDDALRHHVNDAQQNLLEASTTLSQEIVARNAKAGRAAIQRLWHERNGPDWSALKNALPFLPAWAVTSLAARRFPPEPALFDLVVIDEASQCSLPSIVPLLYRARRALIIGDAMQLPHISTLDARSDERLQRRHGISQSWLMTNRLSPVRHSAFAAAERVTGEPLLLDEHYRCHPDVIAVPNRLFYRGRLTVLTDPAAPERTSVAGPAVTWRHVVGMAERGTSGRSWRNPAEVADVALCVQELVAELPESATIGVVTPYAPQKDALCEALATFGDRVRVGTVHRFQGGERDVMVFSLVASAGYPPRRFDWADQQPELWNVAITRARSRLIVVGDAQVWETRGRIGGALLSAARQGVPVPDGVDNVLLDELYDALASLPRVGVEFGVSVRGYRADAVMETSGGAVPMYVDPGSPPDTDPAVHLLRALKRTALLGDRALRVPAWAVEQGADEIVRLSGAMTDSGDNRNS